MQTLRRTHCIASLSFILLLTGAYSLAAQGVPRTISYQGVLTNSGSPLSDGLHSLAVTVYGPGGESLFTQTLTIETSSGLFSTTLGPFPSTLPFDAAYQLGIAVDGGAEFTPRTPLTSAPYALRAATSSTSVIADRAVIADGLSPDATGLIRQVNGLQGNVQIVGGTGVNVTNQGGNIVISFLGGDTAVGRITSAEGTIAVTNGSGPVASLDVAEGSLQGRHIENRSILSEDLAVGSVGSGEVADGSLDSSDILNMSISNEDLDDDIISTNKIIDGTIETQDIMNDAITSVKIGDYEVTLDKIDTTGAELDDYLRFNGTTAYWWTTPTASVSPDPDAPTLRSLMDRLERLQEENRELARRVATLESDIGIGTAVRADQTERDDPAK